MYMNLNSNFTRRFDLNLMSHIAYGYRQQGLDLGVSYRQDIDKNGAQGLNISPIVKLRIGVLRIGMAYDIGLSDIAKEAGNGVLFRSEEQTSELQSRGHLVCRLLLET